MRANRRRNTRNGQNQIRCSVLAPPTTQPNKKNPFKQPTEQILILEFGSGGGGGGLGGGGGGGEEKWVSANFLYDSPPLPKTPIRLFDSTD